MTGYRKLSGFGLVCVSATILTFTGHLTGGEFAQLVGGSFGAFCIANGATAFASRPLAPEPPLPGPQTVVNVAPGATP